MWLSEEQKLALAAFAKNERESVGLSVAEAAKEAGVSWQSIRSLERGRPRLSSARGIAALAALYQCDADEFCRLAGFCPEDIQRALMEPGAFERVRKALKLPSNS